jgi:hypothetical protein
VLTAEARVATDRAGRYLVQFCRHASAMGHAPGGHGPGGVRVRAEWTDTAGTVTVTPWGRCTLVAEPTALVFRVTAASEADLRRLQEVVSRDVARFGRRDQLTVRWQPVHPDPEPTA